MTLSKSKTSTLTAGGGGLSNASSTNGSGVNTAANNGSVTNSSSGVVNSNNSLNKSNCQECADCSSPSAIWASLNHGVVICDQCCLAHRSLGRCISIIKSLRKSYWPQSLIDTLYELVRSNSNSIWEANLNNPNELVKQPNLKNIKKPTPKDTYATKLNFIKIKYENLAFISRGKYSSIEELNQQLLASVKTNNYESTLRILSQGADANYRSQDEGYQCIHAAALNNQIGQIELLCLYGADVTSLDRNGMSAYDLAKMNGLQHICDRLVELQFELTDELSFFLCNKRPDHKNGKHFLIPDTNENNGQVKEIIGKLKLDELPDHLFEELSKDIYDEMDRRQIETIWKCTVSQNLVNEPIPFLIIKSCFTQTRNQLRQKLARFNNYEFSSLLIEILNEAQRRYNQIDNFNSIMKDDDDPLYDRVPSDEDYASVASESSSTIHLAMNEPTMKSTSTSSSTATTTPTVTINQQPESKSKLAKKINSPLSVSTAMSAKNSSGSNMITSPSIPMASSISDTVGMATAATNKNCLYSPSSTCSSSSSSNKSNKNTPSPSTSTKFNSKEHKILNTRFEKAPTNLSSNNSTLVANAESALNSIINSLNQIDYSHLGQHIEAPMSPKVNKKINDFSTADRANLVNELKSENELMQAMIERLMEENAQLRAEKMLLTTSSTTVMATMTTSQSGSLNPMTSSTINSSSNYMMSSGEAPLCSYLKSPYQDDLSLYATVKNKKPQKSGDEFHLCESPGDDFKSNNKKNYQCAEDRNLEIIEESSSLYSEELCDYGARSPTKSKSDKCRQESFNYSKSVTSSLSPTNKSAKSVQHSKSMMHTSRSPANSYQEVTSSANNSHLPSKDSVIKKMKKITKTVQDLFKATKQSNFSSLKLSCDKVNQAVNEMIVLFPTNLNSVEIELHLSTLEETCKNLSDLVNKYGSKIDLFVSMGSSMTLMPGEAAQSISPDATLNADSKPQVVSASSSSSSAISSSSDPISKQQQQLSQEDAMIKNMIVTNLVSHSYEIAHTVKRIVCAMGADN